MNIGNAIIPDRLKRMPYFLRSIATFAVLFGVASIPKQYPSEDLHATIVTVLGLSAIAYNFVGLIIPRLADIGWSAWLIILVFIPVVNVILSLLLYFMPSKKEGDYLDDSEESEQPCLNENLEFSPDLPPRSKRS